MKTDRSTPLESGFPTRSLFFLLHHHTYLYPPVEGDGVQDSPRTHGWYDAGVRIFPGRLGLLNDDFVMKCGEGGVNVDCDVSCVV